MDCLELCIPGQSQRLIPGCVVKLGRFDSVAWRVLHGWYSWGNNRPVCGWYLISTDYAQTVKPLQQTDLDDIYIVEYGR